MASRSRNLRWHVKKTLRKAEAVGRVDIDLYRGAGQIRAALDTWFAIERQSWQGGNSSSAMGERGRRFHALLLDELSEEEVGDLWIVKIDSTPAAALRMLASPGRVSVHTMHFAAAFRELAPGAIAFAEMMRDAADRGLREVDMHGTTEFFRRWATGDRPHVSVRSYRPGLRGAALRGARTLKNAARWTGKLRRAAESGAG